MTGAIFPLLASVATGNDNPLANANDVKALEETCVAPEMKNCFIGSPGTPPVTLRPMKPTTTLARASRNCKNHACVNLEPSAEM